MDGRAKTVVIGVTISYGLAGFTGTCDQTFFARMICRATSKIEELKRGL